MGVFHFGHSTPASSHGLPYHGNFGTYSQYYSSRRSLRRVFLDLCFYLGVQVEKEKDIEAKIRTFEINERIALLIEASILCEIAPANVTFVLSRKQKFVLLNMGFGKSKGLSRKSLKAKRDQRYLEGTFLLKCSTSKTPLDCHNMS